MYLSSRKSCPIPKVCPSSWARVCQAKPPGTRRLPLTRPPVADPAAVLLIRLVLMSTTTTLMLFDRSKALPTSLTAAQVPSI